MPLFIKESFLYKFFDKIIIKPYNNSKFKAILSKLSFIFKKSILYRLTEKYLDKKPYFLSSLTYKGFRKFISIIDKIMDFINRVGKKCLSGSNVASEISSAKALEKDKKLLLASILISAFNLAYIITSIVFTSLNSYISSALIVLSFVLYLFSLNPNCYKQSFIYKIFKSW